jgi:hypothetical protein
MTRGLRTISIITAISGADPCGLVARSAFARHSLFAFRRPLREQFRRPRKEQGVKLILDTIMLHDCRLIYRKAARCRVRMFPMDPAPDQSASLPCPCCHGTRPLVRHLNLQEPPEIYIFYCSRCQYVEPAKQERAA